MSISGAINVIPKRHVSAHLASLFKTPSMQRLAVQPASSVKRLCDSIARGPLFTFRPLGFDVDPAAETNFTAWWRLLALRDKPKSHPMMEDMYLLHEYFHLATMPYFDVIPSFDQWKAKMLDNEQEASFYSEAYIYQLHPELRSEFPLTEIWADNFTAAQFEQGLLARFIAESDNRNVNPHQLRAIRFVKANSLWCTEYWPIACKVERHMAQFHEACALQGDETEIVFDHLGFIRTHSQQLSDLANSYNEKWHII